MPAVDSERSLVVFDDIRSMPLYDEPYTTDLMTISINLSGWVKAEQHKVRLRGDAHADAATRCSNRVRVRLYFASCGW